MVISSTVQLSRYSKESAPKGLKVMQTMGYVLMAVLIIGFVFTICSNKGADCFTPLLIFNLLR
jgi:hypothetical protein